MADIISSELGVLIMMNNYFHDVATALLLSSAVAIWVMMRRYDETGESGAVDGFFLRIYKSMTRLAIFSLFWILLGGIPRTIFYKSMEWQTALDHAQIPALIVKHVLAFFFVGTGVYVWHKINRRVREIKERTEGEGVS